MRCRCTSKFVQFEEGEKSVWFIIGLVFTSMCAKRLAILSHLVEWRMNGFNILNNADAGERMSQINVIIGIGAQTLIVIRMTDLYRWHSLPWMVHIGTITQHALHALNMPVFLLMLKLNVLLIATTNWCVLANSLSDESVKELCSAAWNDRRLACRFKGYDYS